jgi:hypothetical protein
MTQRASAHQPSQNQTLWHRLGIALAPLLLAGCYAAAPPPPKAAEEPAIEPLPPTEMRSLTAQEKALLTKGFASSLKDPGSAQFQWTKVPKRLPADSALDYCGMVNAKNSYGGYTGANPYIGMIFITNGKIIGGSIVATADPRPGYAEIVPNMCRKKGLNPYAISEG